MTKLEKVIYTAQAHTTGGRDNGASRTSDGRLDVQLSVPGKPGGLSMSSAMALGCPLETAAVQSLSDRDATFATHVLFQEIRRKHV